MVEKPTLMKECILGISSFGHDTSACLIDFQTSETIFASSQERFSNVKYDDAIPFYTIAECLKIAQKLNYKVIKASLSCDFKLFLGNFFFDSLKTKFSNDELALRYFNLLKKNLIYSDYFSKYNYKNNFIKKFFEENIASLSSHRINDILDFTSWYYNWALKHRNIQKMLQKFIGKIELIPVSHHLSHAASAYFNSGFDYSNIIVFDGQGEQDTISIYEAKKNNIKILSNTSWPYSLGTFYLAGTNYLGYNLGDEYKVMGMSAYGQNKYKDYFDNSLEVNSKGEFKIKETDYIGFKNIKYTNHKNIYFKEKFSEFIKPNKNINNLKQNHFDFAKSLQSSLEDVGIKLSEWAYEKTQLNKICLSGGVALNGLLNNKILQLNYFDDAYVYPASGDDGTSVGSALYLISTMKNQDMNTKKLHSCFHGFKDNFNFEKHKKLIKNLNITKSVNPFKFVAEKINENKVVAIFSKGAEFGPRSLGARSILANATHSNMKEILNKKIKLREPFRPFAPACLEEYVNDYFLIKNQSEFMLLFVKLSNIKKLIPAVVHNDGTARVQSVSRKITIYLKF